MGRFRVIVSILLAHALAAMSLATTTLSLGVASPTVTNACGSYAYYSVRMLDPCQDLVVSVAKTAGEPTIFISRSVRNFEQSATSSYQCPFLLILTYNYTHSSSKN